MRELPYIRSRLIFGLISYYSDELHTSNTRDGSYYERCPEMGGEKRKNAK
jgi:hypothetical protein